MDATELTKQPPTRKTRRLPRRLTVGAAASAIVVVLAATAIATRADAPARVSAIGTTTTATGSSTTASESTTVVPTTTTAVSPEPHARPASPSAETVDGPADVPAIGTTTSGPPPPDPDASPWPEGTTMGLVGLDGNVEFTPATAVEGTGRAFTATLTNPTDHWVFGTVENRGLALHLYSHDDEYEIPTIVEGYAPGTAPEFQHETPAGPVRGLLLAPHASYSFSGRAYTEDPCATTDYVMQADIIYAPVGVADASGQIVTRAGSYTVTSPTPDPSC